MSQSSALKIGSVDSYDPQEFKEPETPMSKLVTEQIKKSDKLLILTPEEVASIIRKPVRRIYELVKELKLTAIKDGRKLTFSLADVYQYIERHRTIPSPISTLAKTLELKPSSPPAKRNYRVNPG